MGNVAGANVLTSGLVFVRAFLSSVLVYALQTFPQPQKWSRRRVSVGKEGKCGGWGYCKKRLKGHLRDCSFTKVAAKRAEGFKE